MNFFNKKLFFVCLFSLCILNANASSQAICEANSNVRFACCWNSYWFGTMWVSGREVFPPTNINICDSASSRTYNICESHNGIFGGEPGTVADACKKYTGSEKVIIS